MPTRNFLYPIRRCFNLQFACVLLALLIGPMSSVFGEEVGELTIRDLLPLDAAERQRLRLIVAGDPDAGALFDRRAAEARRLLDATPRPLAKIEYEGLVNTDPRRVRTVEHLADMDALAAMFEWWQASDDARAAAKCVEYVAAWTATYTPTGNDVNDNKLLPVIIAGSALRGRMTDAQATQFQTWLNEMGRKHRAAAREQTERRTNRYTKRLRLMALVALSLDDRDLLRDVRVGFEQFVTTGLYPDGTSEDLKRRDTLTYHSSALAPLLDIATFARGDDRDWYRWESPTGSSVKKSLDYLVPYADGTLTRQEWVNTTVDLDRRRAAAGLSAYQPGKLFDPQDALDELEQASYFDPNLLPLVAKLAGSPSTRFPTWRTLVQAAARPEPQIEK
ncbi:MAG TPA: alginate lyase family protein [Tepidisphaeraceae bacterium]|jgi:hypothetical protein|nr:alginate lyase family protein [Tepidisphaeraceae bacterium]